MRLRWKVLLGVLAALAVLLALNTIVLDRETKPAEVTVPGGRILSLNGGDLQVVDLPPTSSRQEPGRPVVLLHCYTCAIDWWDRLIPLLRRDHRVIAVDLLGHGGSEKPSSGYSMPEQADLIAEALGRLGVRGATVVGHSLGGTVATALTVQSPDLVSRLVLIDQAPDNSYGQLSLLARLTYWPVLGEALWRLTPDFAIKDALGQAFAPGYDVPDRFVDDVRRMTFNAYDTVGADEDDYTKQEPLDARIRAAGLPLLVIFGGEDQIYDARRALSAYAAIRGAHTALIEGAGHSPNVEKPEQVAKLIDAFAAPEPEPGRRGSGTSFRSAVAKCGSAIIGPGRPDWRGHAGGRRSVRPLRRRKGLLQGAPDRARNPADQDHGDRRGSRTGGAARAGKRAGRGGVALGPGPRSLAGSAGWRTASIGSSSFPAPRSRGRSGPGACCSPAASASPCAWRAAGEISGSASAELSRLATTPRSSDATVRDWRRPLVRPCRVLLPAAAGLGPGGHVGGRAEAVGDPVLAAVADEEDGGFLERRPAVRAEVTARHLLGITARHLLRFASGGAGVFGRRR